MKNKSLIKSPKVALDIVNNHLKTKGLNPHSENSIAELISVSILAGYAAAEARAEVLKDTLVKILSVETVTDFIKIDMIRKLVSEYEQKESE